MIQPHPVTGKGRCQKFGMMDTMFLYGTWSKKEAVQGATASSKTKVAKPCWLGVFQKTSQTNHRVWYSGWCHLGQGPRTFSNSALPKKTANSFATTQ